MPPAGDAQETRRRLVEAAYGEFATHGIAGARVDRVAAAAGVNKALIYFHFSNKEGLFTAVFNQVVGQALALAPMDATNLPEYAGLLFDAGLAHPDALRLAAWHRLERAADQPPLKAVLDANQSKVDAIAKAQEAGYVTTRFTAAEVLALVLTIANMWSVLTPEQHLTAPQDPAARRALVVSALTTLLQP
ncbi:TetR family transcriptional regulator [Asanoa ishikariensis]|uniref:Transcriptional regulator, TetR family n=1 Tax=Asanoa ishikariensis TaxID=137265 RepID=A0A1H3L7M7_9ACTN|nr:TetR family transcriptional regulator [Asanoa ishikariensis]GIF65310.1 TetR family transcriptional regulator [Asanoa ishikariensis]SDY60433.1 transcriptional regulator, TetR family [Asanoa ishikariensis]